jgi:aminopeptidase N
LQPAGQARAGVAVTPFGSAPGADAVDVSVLASPNLTGRRRATADGVAAMLTFYGKLLGDAPYPSLAIALLEDLVPGGHSPAGFVMFNQPHVATPYTWTNDPVWFAEAPDFFLAHEVAHQWWGQAVGGRNYHELWTSEGFSQYMAWLYIESVEGPEVSRRLLSRMKATASESASQGPIYLGNRIGHLRGNSRAFRAIVYNKSALVLHMLRRLMGDAPFFDGLRALYATSRFTRIGLDDVERQFQARTAISLQPFFRQWLLGTADPSIDVATAVESGAVRLRVDQATEPHIFPLDFVLEYEDGSQERISVAVTERNQEFRRTVPRPVRRITIDDAASLVRVRRAGPSDPPTKPIQRNAPT